MTAWKKKSHFCLKVSGAPHSHRSQPMPYDLLYWGLADYAGEHWNWLYIKCCQRYKVKPKKDKHCFSLTSFSYRNSSYYLLLYFKESLALFPSGSTWAQEWSSYMIQILVIPVLSCWQAPINIKEAEKPLCIF